jgi:hypothetical protein
MACLRWLAWARTVAQEPVLERENIRVDERCRKKSHKELCQRDVTKPVNDLRDSAAGS